MMDSYSSIYADYICGATFDKLPSRVVTQAKQSILDLMAYPWRVIN